MNDAGAMAGWIIISVFAFIVGFVATLLGHRYRVVRR